MRQFLETVPIQVQAVDNGIIFDIIVSVFHKDSSAVVRICQYHTNLVYIQKEIPSYWTNRMPSLMDVLKTLYRKAG